MFQDRWTLKNLTLTPASVGPAAHHRCAGVTQIDLKKDYAPRLGFVWDPSGANHSKVFGSFGRYYEEIPMDLVIRSFLMNGSAHHQLQPDQHRARCERGEGR